MTYIKSPASERIRKEQDYRAMSDWCWSVFLGLSLLVFAFLVIFACDTQVEMVELLLSY